MFPDDELNQLQDRISQMSDKELLRIVEVEYEDYRKEALEFAETELQKRGVPFERPEPGTLEPETDEDEQAESTDPAVRSMRCPECGTSMRAGILFADKELTMVFSDDNEERFVEAFGCKACGAVRLALDLDTDVEN
jgi:hypothetical protein